MPQIAGLYSFVAALAVKDVITECLPTHTITLKWPNDVLVDGKKISGILLEVEGNALIVGVGLNIEHYPDNTLYPTTSLMAEGGIIVAVDAMNHLLHRLSHWHDVMQSEGFEPIRASWLHHAKKGQLTVRLSKETVQGEFVGIDHQGRLLLQLEGGAERAISTGDVFFAPKD
jgi:BirA family transcriptional regulator, biotin operon repressor / biotin---[acetyl-CoA-carboxylase] ligase